MATTASLERVMDGLGESEKYNAVLQGVSSLVMGKKKGGAAAKGAFEEVFQLLDEMHANRIKCTIRTASAVVDAATATTSIGIITEGIMYHILLYGLVDRVAYQQKEHRLHTYLASSLCDAVRWV